MKLQYIAVLLTIGVGAVVFNAAGDVLLIRRGKEPQYGRWMVPGGTLEWG